MHVKTPRERPFLDQAHPLDGSYPEGSVVRPLLLEQLIFRFYLHVLFSLRYLSQ